MTAAILKIAGAVKTFRRVIARRKRRRQVRALYFSFLGEVYGTNLHHYAAKPHGAAAVILTSDNASSRKSAARWRSPSPWRRIKSFDAIFRFADVSDADDAVPSIEPGAHRRKIAAAEQTNDLREALELELANRRAEGAPAEMRRQAPAQLVIVDEERPVGEACGAIVVLWFGHGEAGEEGAAPGCAVAFFLVWRRCDRTHSGTAPDD